ncbi:hypothetical protein LC040_07135 [Bacillus tianshenii]|nr:hypothetical protein LC040_07135 [Bacillus tianshenii]
MKFNLNIDPETAKSLKAISETKNISFEEAIELVLNRYSQVGLEEIEKVQQAINNAFKG